MTDLSRAGGTSTLGMVISGLLPCEISSAPISEAGSVSIEAVVLYC